MIDFAKLLEQAPNGVLATQDGAGVKTRVFQYLFADGNKVYFCTGSNKPVYAQMMANPNVSFCTYVGDFMPVLSLNGKAVFVEDMALKARVLEQYPMIKGIFESAENPVFKVFYIEVENIETYSYAEGAKNYTL